MKLLKFFPVVVGVILAAYLPLWGIVVLVAYSLMCAREARRLKNFQQLNDWNWEHDLASLRRAAYRLRRDSSVSFLRPRKFHGRR